MSGRDAIFGYWLSVLRLGAEDLETEILELRGLAVDVLCIQIENPSLADFEVDGL